MSEKAPEIHSFFRLDTLRFAQLRMVHQPTFSLQIFPQFQFSNRITMHFIRSICEA